MLYAPVTIGDMDFYPGAVCADTIPAYCTCDWYQCGDSPWVTTRLRKACPLHGWTDLTLPQVTPVLDWLETGWHTAPPEALARDIAALRRDDRLSLPLSVAPIRRLGELMSSHPVPFSLHPAIRVMCAAAPQPDYWRRWRPPLDGGQPGDPYTDRN